MNLVTGAMGSLLPKLAELLKEEYKLPKSVKKGVKSLQEEMKSMHAALRVVAEVPRDQLDEQVKLWAGEVRELSFDMEDVVDKFLVRVDDDSEPDANTNKLKLLIEKMTDFFSKRKTRHQIADAIKEINEQVQEVANRRGRYTVDNIVVKPAAVTSIDPRLGALYTEVTELVGVAGKRDEELMKLLSEGDDETKKKLKIVSVVGFGGLGKTTLVKTVYDKIKGDFDCSAFVPVGQSADAKKVFIDILLDLGIYQSHFTMLNERQLINKLRESLENKSDDDSKRLFYKRIFSHEDECPHEFEELSIDILKKCGGVPLAIITIASLLASGDQQVKHVDEWQALLESIGRGLTEDPSVEEMLRILSFSYYDLPTHLKTCLLYLSMFPEDYKIGKDRLIWMWIAESFVQSEKAETCLFEIGEIYFNELVNRNMILPVYDDDDIDDDEGTVVACRVHDMVLELISSLSSKDNFVTVLNGTGDSMSSRSNVRRLSLQNARKGELQTMPLESVSMFQVRSVAAFKPGIELMPPFSSFVVLRVLELNGCDLSDHNHLNLRELGSLLHIRYLGLAKTGISELPEEVGKLQFLQVLDLSGNYRMELPSSVIKLRRLMCLFIGGDHKRLPDGMGNLTSMEELSVIQGSLFTVKELGSMERLRKLKIGLNNLSLELGEAFVESLGKLSNIQSLIISYGGDDVEAMDLLGERLVLPRRSLREFVMLGYNFGFSTLPALIRRDPVHLSQLSLLTIEVEEVRQEDLDILGRLPALLSLALSSRRQSGLLLVGADGFRCLTSFKLHSWSPGPVVFQPGALPKAEKVELDIGLRVANEEAYGNGGDRFDPSEGMGNLLSLREVVVKILCRGVTYGEVRKAAAALRSALPAHPNRPNFRINVSHWMRQGAHDDEECGYDHD